MIEPSLIARTERDVLLDYELRRRFNLLRTITPAFIVIASLVLLIVLAALVVLPLNAIAYRGLYITAILLVCTDIILGAALLALYRANLNLATVLVAGISALGVAASLAIWGTTLGLDLFAMIELTPFSIIIVLAGLVGNRWAIVGAAIGMNIATLVLLLYLLPSPQTQAIWYQERPLIISVSLIYQWLFAVIMIVIWDTFAHTLTEIGTAYERAKQLESLKDAFISSVNHELRTPLMTMLTYIETLRERPTALPPEQLVAVLNHVCRVGEDLSELVKSILSARHIDQEASNFTPEIVRVRPVIEKAIELVAAQDSEDAQQSLQQRDLHLRIGETLQLWGDPVRLQQILTNLLSNALKYSDPGTPIEVSARQVVVTTPIEEWGEQQLHVLESESEPAIVGQSNQQNKRVERATRTGGLFSRRQPTTSISMTEIIVRDFGQGIPPEQIPLLFNRFVRLPRDLASSISGNGLGLYLCRLYAEAMGGKIWVKSSGLSGEGSIFYLLLPADALAVAAQSSEAPKLVASSAPASTPLPV